MPARINPNRMELFKLKKRLKMARRGHKLMKDKFDELLKEFTHLVYEAHVARVELEALLIESYGTYAELLASHGTGAVESVFFRAPVEAHVKTTERRRAGVPLIDATLTFRAPQDKKAFVFLSDFTPLLLDVTEGARNALKAVVRLAETEHNVLLLAAEMERTRRRVNALEQVLIPQLERQIKLVTARLDEMDRESRTRVMKVKEMLETARHE
jgi:V/A-type H+-transporting ATPase subunit D